jgi:hypothetical protein
MNVPDFLDYFDCRPGRNEARASAGLGVATFRPFRVASAAEKIATIIDSIKFCTACHVEGRGFESRRSRHFQSMTYGEPV